MNKTVFTFKQFKVKKWRHRAIGEIASDQGDQKGLKKKVAFELSPKADRIWTCGNGSQQGSVK